MITKIAFQAQGKVIGLNANLAFISKDNQLVFMGRVDTENTTLTEVLLNEEWGVAGILQPFQFHKTLNKPFAFNLYKTPTIFSLEFKYDTKDGTGVPALYCNLVLAQNTKQLAFAIDAEMFKSSENSFEKFVYHVMDFLAIKNLALVIRNSTDKDINKYLNENTQKYLPDTLTQDKYDPYGILVNAVFNLKNSSSVFGKGLYTLTGLDEFQLFVGSTLNAEQFEAVLFAENIKKESFTINRLEFGIKKDTSIRIAAKGDLSFILDKNKLEFVIAGEVSPTSFTLSASSKGRIPLNDKIFISDLGLVIGVSAGVVFGMTGRATVSTKSGYALSMFAGFVVDVATPKVTLLTAALSSTTGKISLKDIVVEIAEVEFAGVEALDIISIQDFDLQNTTIKNWKKDDTVQNIYSNFNSSITKELALTSDKDVQLTPLGDSQILLTDTATMRHFRIDGNGVVSLNCQIYTCVQSVQIGQYTMPAGFFLCGTLELFGFKVRALFMVEPKNSVLALVEASALKIGDVLEFRRSHKSLPMEPIEGGLAGTLINRSSEGPVLYFHVNKSKQIVEFYLSAYLNIADIFKLDALVLLKNKRIYVDTQTEFVGFNLLIKLDADYNDFSKGNFSAKVVFDTKGFIQILEGAQQKIKDAAVSVQKSIEDATRKLDEAKADVQNLSQKINSYNSSINDLKRRIDDSPWYRVDEKISYSAQILYFEGLKVGIQVAIGVASAALDVAKAAMRFGGDLAAGILRGVANIIASITKILWINRFELEIVSNEKQKKLRALLDLTVFGNNLILEGEIDFKKAIDDLASIVKDFVKEKLTGQSQKVIKDIEDGKVVKAVLHDSDEAEFSALFEKATQNRELFDELLGFHNRVEDFIVESNKLYQNTYDHEPEDWQKNIVELTELKLQTQIVQDQCVEVYDNEFVADLEQVIEVIRENHPRDNSFEELNTKMTDLSSVVSTLNSQNNVKAFREQAPLFARMESAFENNMQAKRARLADSVFDKTEADARYIDSLAALFNSSFDEKAHPIVEDFKNSVAAAIYQFRNPLSNDERE